MRREFLALAVILPLLSHPLLLAQAPSAEQVQVQAPLRRAEPPSPNASVDELAKRGDELRAGKAFLDSLDYYQAAIVKAPKDASLYNRMGIAQLQLQRWNDAKKSFERATKLDSKFSDAFNNLGVVEYEQKKFRNAIKHYEHAIALREDAASYYSNLGAAYFSRKEFDRAAVAYAKALELDPEVFERNSRTGVSAQLPSPEDRARYEYVLAKLYAKAGSADRSLEHLRRAMEDGYKGITDVYKDAEFTEVRKDPRFAQLMASKPIAIPE